MPASSIASKVRPLRAAKPSDWLTVKEAAAELGVGEDMIYKACATRGLKHVKFGRSTIRIKREWLEAWAESLAATSA